MSESAIVQLNQKLKELQEHMEILDAEKKVAKETIDQVIAANISLRAHVMILESRVKQKDNEISVLKTLHEKPDAKKDVKTEVVKNK